MREKNEKEKIASNPLTLWHIYVLNLRKSIIDVFKISDRLHAFPKLL